MDKLKWLCSLFLERSIIPLFGFKLSTGLTVFIINVVEEKFIILVVVNGSGGIIDKVVPA